MSGTSLDGLDMVCVDFNNYTGIITHQVIATSTVNYTNDFKLKLQQAIHLSGLELSLLSNEFATLTAHYVTAFIQEYKLVNIDYVSSHGHTIFHQPQHNLTLQIGNGALIAALTGINCVCDFRTGDVAHGGQGAPLVPIGDKLLFNNYDACLNIGGFANVSYMVNGVSIAYDIAPANIVLNYLTQQINLPYDANGAIAKTHTVDTNLLAQLNSLAYYKKLPPKSLGVEWINEHVLPLLHLRTNYEVLIATLTEHTAMQIAQSINNQLHINTVLTTGGGAFNEHLINRIQAYSVQAKYIVTNPETIGFKEAIIFALLGYLRVNNMPNALASVTGANHDSCTGAIYLAS